MSRYICLLLVSLLCCPQTLTAQTETDTPRESVVRGVQYATATADSLLRPLPLLSGISVSADLAGAVMALAAPYGTYEGALRVNLRGRYFPVVEAGWGVSDHTDESTMLHYRTSAPFFRLGCDYNIARNPRSDGRIFVGLRYGFSSFHYDYSGPDIIDPEWGTATPFAYSDLKGSAGWGEILFGLEAKIVTCIHIGWSARYRYRLHQSYETPGPAWYIPGFGKNGSTTLGAGFYLTIDI